MRLVPDKSVDTVFSGETGNGFILVFPDAARQIDRAST
jgi:hypothetical protein